MRVADADIARHRIGGQHHPHGDEEKGRVDQADDDRDLKQIEKYFELYASAPMGVWKEEHHQNRSAIEGVKQSARRFRQEGLPEHRAEDLQDCGNSQDHQHDAEQKPKQRGNALGATECNPCASDGDQALQHDDGFGKATACLSRAEHEEAQPLNRDHGSEQNAHDPGSV